MSLLSSSALADTSGLLVAYGANDSVVVEFYSNESNISSVTVQIVDNLSNLYVGSMHSVDVGMWRSVFPIKPDFANFSAYVNRSLAANLSRNFSWTAQARVPAPALRGSREEIRGNTENVSVLVDNIALSNRSNISGIKPVHFYEDDKLVLSIEHNFSSALDLSEISLYTYGDGGVGARAYAHTNLTLYVLVNGNTCNVRVCPNAVSGTDCDIETMYYAYSEPIDGFCVVNVSGTYAKDEPEQTDFIINDTSIVFTPDTFIEDANITINVTVLNNGLTWADNVTVLIIDNKTGDILENHTIANFTSGSVEYVAASIAPEIGSTRIDAQVDPFNVFNESNDSNNNGSKWINVSSWHTIYGFVSGTVAIGNTQGNLYVWDATITSGNIYAVDSDASVDWDQLYALGRNTSNEVATTDFSDVDTALNLSDVNDNVSALFSLDGTVPRQTRTFSIYDDTILSVPIVNSTNVSSFVTAILWDSADDSDFEFDTAELEDLVFVTSVNVSQTGAYGVYDYELRVPSTLGETKGSNGYVSLYMDLDR